jgi:hypothetical protein
MARVLFALGVLLMGWGAYVLFTGDFVATLDIAAGLVGSGVGVIALGAVVGALDRIARQLADRPPVSVTVPPPAKAEYAPPRAAAEPAAPTLVREGVVDGRRYRFFSDGSIEADGPHGLRRYRSMDEAREDILQNRGDQDTPQPRAPAQGRASRPAKQSWESYLPAGHRTEDRDADRYAPPERSPADASPEDDEWSEPFRMLLKGDPDPSTPPPKRR